MLASQVIYDFSKTDNADGWTIVDDVVMGGRSNGRFVIDKDGHGQFSGKVSLDNNGGFSSVRYRNSGITTIDFSKIKLLVKGDGSRYQLRIKDDADNYYSYIAYFETTGEWETIEILLKNMYPTFRGRNLDMSNYASDQIEEVAILIGNKKAQTFELLIDKIVLED